MTATLDRLDRELYSPEALVAWPRSSASGRRRVEELVPALAAVDRSKLYVDLSSNNAAPNITRYAGAGHKRISLKATEGTGYAWTAGNAIHQAAHRHQLGVERYGWLRPEYDPVDQADFFLDTVGPYMRRGDNYCCDFERSYNYSTGHPVPESDDERARQLVAFMSRIQDKAPAGWAHNGRVYTGNWYLAELGPKSRAAIKRYPVVMSDYANNPPPNPYGLDYVAVQFTDRANVPGCPSPVDYNRLLVDPVSREEITVKMSRQALAKFVNAHTAPRMNRLSNRISGHRKILADHGHELASLHAKIAELQKGQKA